MEKTAIIILGPQGSGKGTQAKLLAEKINAPIIGTGSLLKKAKDSNSLIGKIIGLYINNGYLVPLFIVKMIIRQRLNQLERKSVMIFDGIPRTAKQITILDSILDEEDFNQIVVIHFNLSDEEAIIRLKKRARFDDTDKIIHRRLHLYHQKINPILNVYKKRGVLITVNAALPIPEIQKNVYNHYQKFIKSNASI